MCGVSEVAAVLALVVQLVASSLAPQAAAAAAGKLTGAPFRHSQSDILCRFCGPAVIVKRIVSLIWQPAL